jgi:hypothetical protein
VMTIGAGGFVPGHDVDWLVSQAETRGVAALRTSGLTAGFNRPRPFVLLKRSAG